MSFSITGRVVDARTGSGVGGVRVEAWDMDPGADDYLGATMTVTDGSFAITFADHRYRDLFFDVWPDVYFRVYYAGALLTSTQSSVIWNARDPLHVTITIPPLPVQAPCIVRDIYLKIEHLHDYSPVRPHEKAHPPLQYGRDCMRNEGHEDATIPPAEIEARGIDAVTYREYLDSAYLVPKTDKLILADVNEPPFDHRIPGTVIYTRPCERLRIHVWNCDHVPHSFHLHGLKYGIDSDGSWPFGTQDMHGRRSDAICPDGTWTYVFDVTDEMIGAWPFHDHTHHHFMGIDQGLFGGIVVLAPHEQPPRRFPFPIKLFGEIYHRLAEMEHVKLDLDLTALAGGPELAPEAPDRPMPRPTVRPVEHDIAPPHSHSESHSHNDSHDHPHDNQHGTPHEDVQGAVEPLEQALRLPPRLHYKRLGAISRRYLADQLEFLHELIGREMLIKRRPIPTDHVPVFFHLISGGPSTPTFDSGDLTALVGAFEHTFGAAGDHEYFCQHHPIMTGVVHVVPGAAALATVNLVDGPPMSFSPADVTVDVGGKVRWENHSTHTHTVTSKAGASIPTHCINGRGFVGNTPTIVASSGQRIRWYVFNLDTGEAWHNFHPHAMRWTFAGQTIDVRSMSPAESFVVETEIPPVMLLEDDVRTIQDPAHRPPNAKRYVLKGDFVFHCHVHHHMMNGMVGLVRAKQTVWLTDTMADHLRHERGLPVDDGTNACPDVDPHPCAHGGMAHWEEVTGNPEVAMMHSVLLPNMKTVLYWGYTRADQTRVWDYSTAAGAYSQPANQPASLPGLDESTSDLWSAEHAILDTPEGHVLAHGGFTPNRSFEFDPTTLSWQQVASTAEERFYSTTLVIGDGRALTLFGSATKSIEAYTRGAGWAAPVALPATMNHHLYYPWTYLLEDGRLFIAGPHVPTQLFDWTVPTVSNTFNTIGGDRSTGGEKASSVLLILRPPDYKPVVLIMGGNTPTTENTAEQIDLSAAAPAWSALPDLNVARPEQFTATLLPDGRVFLAGGVSGGADGGPCEIYDPRNPALGWQLGPTMKYVRTYHSSFVLLTDGSVLAGGDPMGPDGNPTPHERFYPDYYDMPRPAIANAPATINYAAMFVVDTPNAVDIDEVILLRPGATTHGYNMSQRGIECVIAAVGAATLDVETPPNANLAPPGWYLLFLVDSSRMPSEGRWIRLTP